MSEYKFLLLLFIILLTILISGCLAGNERFESDNPAGFFYGIWHGWIAPFSLIIGFFNPSVKIYEVVNTGWNYDLGFYMAIISGFGTLSLLRK